LLEQPLPAFQRPTVGGGSVNTHAPAGRVVVVKFFAKYCQPCVRTLPEVERVHRAHVDVLFIGIAEDAHPRDVQEMIDRFGLSFPVIHDAGNQLAARFLVRQLPKTFVVDASGRVRWVGGERQTEDDLRDAIAVAKAFSQ
jgi:peroxiredoxin